MTDTEPPTLHPASQQIGLHDSSTPIAWAKPAQKAVRKLLLPFLLTLILSAGCVCCSWATDVNTDLRDFPKWQDVIQRSQFHIPSHVFEGDIVPLLTRIHRKYRQMPYMKDYEIYGIANYWATRQETRQHGAADCKGFALAEYQDLVEAGVPDTRLWFRVVIVRKTNELHAVLQADDWILDRRAERLLTLNEFLRYYIPIYSINRIGWKQP